MTDLEIMAEAENRLAGWLVKEHEDQLAWKQARGKHRQRLAAVQAHTIDGNNVALRVSVHEYVGPKGAGWVLRLRATVNGNTWMRSVDFGPEGKTHDWVKRLPLPWLAQ